MTFTLNPNSWHFWVANFTTRRVWIEDGSDICSYTRAFLTGLGWLALASFGVALGIAFVVVGLWNTVDFLFYGAPLYPTTAMLWALVAVFGVVASGVAYTDYRERKIQEEIEREREEFLRTGIKPPEKQPGFIRLAFRKFKDKTCFRLEFKSE